MHKSREYFFEFYNFLNCLCRAFKWVVKFVQEKGANSRKVSMSCKEVSKNMLQGIIFNFLFFLRFRTRPNFTPRRGGRRNQCKHFGTMYGHEMFRNSVSVLAYSAWRKSKWRLWRVTDVWKWSVSNGYYYRSFCKYVSVSGPGSGDKIVVVVQGHQRVRVFSKKFGEFTREFSEEYSLVLWRMQWRILFSENWQLIYWLPSVTFSREFWRMSFREFTSSL